MFVKLVSPFINDCLVFDVFSVERKYNIKVSTGNKLCLVLLLMMTRHQPNSRFHGHDIFREIDLLP